MLIFFFTVRRAATRLDETMSLLSVDDDKTNHLDVNIVRKLIIDYRRQ